MFVQVTQADIDRGKRCDGKGCAVALALTRKTGQQWSVYGMRAENDAGQIYVLPSEAGQFIQDFDHGCPVLPFHFETYLKEVAP